MGNDGDYRKQVGINYHPMTWGSIYIFDLKMITFMLKVAIGDYCLVI